MSAKKKHNLMGCKCPKCQSKRMKTQNKTPVNNEWQTFRGNAKAWHDQRRKDEARYNELCGEVIISKKEDTGKDEY